MTTRKPGQAPNKMTIGDLARRTLRAAFWNTVGWAGRHTRDWGAVLLGLSAILTVLGLVGMTRGAIISPWSAFLRRWLGLGAAIVPVGLTALALAMARRHKGQPTAIPWVALTALELALVGILGLLSVVDGLSLSRAEAGAGGGLIGWAMATILGDWLGAFGRTTVLTLASAIFGAIAAWSFLSTLRRGSSAPAWPGQPSVEAGTLGHPVEGRASKDSMPSRRRSSALPSAFKKSFRVVEQPETKVEARRRDERLPDLGILEASQAVSVTSREINLAAGLIEKTLADFGLPARVVDFRSGPAVTQFAVEPGFVEAPGADGQTRKHKVRVSQISSLANDLALALSAPSLRIEAPVPGQAYVGIEVPNRQPAFVRLRAILESEAFQNHEYVLPIAMGRNVSGLPVLADLSAMPHLLIAGTTGSGKSVCITALATCLVMNNHPEDLRLVLIDPKMVELVRFNGLPHLFGKVETELERIAGVLRWCTVEMDRRYRLLEAAKARDIDVYNRRMLRSKAGERLPRIVVMIDELADLMMLNPDQTERTLVRLAQMARATGIHLIVATQRPSTDVVTGLIKANFPARVSFAVASSVDSRVILDTQGAETLLGRGDMLFLSPEAGSPTRLQGVIVSDAEIERLVEYWREEIETDKTSRWAPWEEMLKRKEALGDRDHILAQAIELVRATGEASASMLQRRLRIGYPRAARLLDELEELGIIGGPQSGGRTREVLLTEDDDDGKGRGRDQAVS